MYLKKLSIASNVDIAYIKQLADMANYLYRTFELGTGRKIHAPSAELKGLQILICKTLFDKLPVHSCSAAYNKGCSSFLNAKLHSGNYEYTTRIDFRKFFPSITGDDVLNYLASIRNEFRLTHEDIYYIKLLVCRNNRLTIGAPTSPKISNAICYHLDDKLSVFSAEREIIYTRYADDLCFSYNGQSKKSEILSYVKLATKQLDYPANLIINYNKLVTRKSDNGRRVTGLIANNTDNKVALGKKKYKYYNSMMHHYFVKSDSTFSPDEIKGHINHIKQSDKQYFELLVLKYGASMIKLLTNSA